LFLFPAKKGKYLLIKHLILSVLKKKWMVHHHAIA